MVPTLTASTGGFHASRKGGTKLLLALLLLATALLGMTASAQAAALSPQAFGVNVETWSVGGNLGPSDLAMASGSGVGTMRVAVNEGTNADPLVALAARAGLRLMPLMGLPQQLSPADAASAMAQYVTQFAQRYGPNGSFWSQNHQLPYLPVQDFEIGNEPNIPLQWIADDTNLHWTDPAAYAQVYEAAQSALHAADPSGVAVVGGLADSGNLGVDLQHDEEWLGALTPGTVDAVGFHPYTFPVSFAEMNSDTEALRQWMNAHGMASAPILIDEVGACDITPQTIMNNGPGCLPSISSSDWGSFATSLGEWALCSAALNVTGFDPEYWGDLPTTDINAILALVSSEGTLTPYGEDYLDEAQLLTTQGCPFSNTASPTVTGQAAVGSSLAASAGGWTAASPSIAYQWERCDTAGDCSDIPGATAGTYQVQGADSGYELVASVTASTVNGSESAWSAPTAVVPPPPSQGGPPPGGGTTSGGGAPSHGSGGGSGSGGGGTPPAQELLSMRFQIQSVRVHGRVLTLEVHATPGSGHVSAVATKGKHRLRLRLTQHSHQNTVLTLSVTLPAGHWTVTVVCSPPAGYAVPQSLRRSVTAR